MTERHPGLRRLEPNLEPPTEVLKVLGSPRIEDTDQPTYSVTIPLSRKLAIGEQDYVEGWRTPYPSPAGAVYVGDDMKSLVVIQTTIERVAEHQDFFQTEIVSKIVTEGEAYRTRAVDAQREADEEQSARRDERARRQNLANGINFR